MQQNQTVTVDGIKWLIYGSPRRVQPICPKHSLRMYKTRRFAGELWAKVSTLSCSDCPVLYDLPRTVDSQGVYVIDRLDAQDFSKMKFINLDDEALPISEDKTKDDRFFVKAILTESKVGQRLVVYAGEKGNNKKTQIFIEPNIKRLAFDQTDLHPSDVFLKLEATFKDGTTSSIERSKS